MDIDLKIGAVFSLAGGNKQKEPNNDLEIEKSEPDEWLDTPEYLLPDKDTDDVDVTSCINMTLPLTDHMCYTTDHNGANTNHSTDTSKTAEEDPDAPPSLLMEGKSSPVLTKQSPHKPGMETMSPPVLQREEPIRKDTFSCEDDEKKKKKCTKIDPCYIVLTNIDHVMKGKTSISSRTFKRSFIECSNMCKKVQFKRHLHAGKDVFNVKTPSKQKDYLLYLAQAEKERLKRGKKKVIQFTQIKEILEKHDLKVEARMKTNGKLVLSRIRRTVSRIPKDFAARPKSPVTPTADGTEEDKIDISAEEQARLNRLLIRKHHEVELQSLQRIISIKRHLNHNLKKRKKVKTAGYVNFLRSDVTSSVSGRVRKVNPRYGKDFAVSWRDFEEQRLVEVAHARLKRAESESKKKVEDFRKNSERALISQKRKESSHTEKSDLDQPEAAKKARSVDIIIDNPEESKERSLTNKHKTLKNILAGASLNSEPRNYKVKKNNEKKRLNSRDGVLIQDMPKEENVISGFLQNVNFDDSNGTAAATSSPLDANVVIKIEPGTEPGDQYLHARQLLKESLEKRARIEKSSSSGKQQVVPIQFSAGSNLELEQEKFKQLRIPESVQKLFTHKEIKKEPADEGTVSTSSSNTVSVQNSTNPKIVTVAYSNGVFKKVVLNTSSFRQDEPKSVAKKNQTGASPVPILVNTLQGLRYIVPKESVSKDSSANYSEAMKSKNLSSDVAPGKPSTITLVSPTNLASNTTAKISNKLNAMQSLMPSQLPAQMRAPQQGPQTRLGLLPSVVQIPVQTSLNVASMNSYTKHTLPAPTLLVSQRNTNELSPLQARNVALPMQSAPVQTQTLIQPITQSIYQAQQNSLINNSSKTPTGSQTSVANKQYLDKCKFYLLKIEGKNVLIPINGDQPHPKAYIVNSEVIAGHTQTQNVKNTVASDQAQCVVSSSTVIRPTIIGLQSVDAAIQPKPTLAVQPNMKSLQNIPQSQFTPVQTVVSSPQAKTLSQTVILPSTCVAQNTAVPKGKGNAVSSISSTASVKANQTLVGVARSESKKFTDQTNVFLSSPSVGNIPTIFSEATVYVGSVSRSQTSDGKQLNAVKGGESVIKSKLYVPPACTDKTVFSHKNTPVGVLRDNFSKQKGSTCVTQPAFEPIEIGSSHDDKTKQVKELEHSGGKILCEKSGVIVATETSVNSEEKPQAFKEAVTTREERLRRLKELLKEKQKAVEELRSSKVKPE